MVVFSSSKGNSYPVPGLRTPNTVTSRTWKIWVVCCVWCKSYDARSFLGEKNDHITIQVMWLGEFPSIWRPFLQQSHPISGVQQDYVGTQSGCN
jgi:hypothetical protein